jgi:hypothetical protein
MTSQFVSDAIREQLGTFEQEALRVPTLVGFVVAGEKAQLKVVLWNTVGR